MTPRKEIIGGCELWLGEWRVCVLGAGPWASGTWDFHFAAEGEARAFAQANGAAAYLHDYGAVVATPPMSAAHRDER